MSHDLSIADAVDLRQCDFAGCEACPYQIRGTPSHACIQPGGATALHGLLALSAFTDVPCPTLPGLLGPDLELARVGPRHEYDVASAAQVASIVAIATAIVDATHELVDRGTGRVPPEHLDRARATLGPWVESCPDVDGQPHDTIFSGMVRVEAAVSFLEAAVGLGTEVELGRYDVGVGAGR